jgi:hypothetical protein
MLEINNPEVLKDVWDFFLRYEAALVGNDVASLDSMFWDSPHAIRFGAGENLYGYAAIKAFRAGRSPQGLARALQNSVITTFGTDFATTATEYVRDGQARVGRQMQTLVRFPVGWRIVAAHVSLIGG